MATALSAIAINLCKCSSGVSIGILRASGIFAAAICNPCCGMVPILPSCSALWLSRASLCMYSCSVSLAFRLMPRCIIAV